VSDDSPVGVGLNDARTGQRMGARCCGAGKMHVDLDGGAGLVGPPRTSRCRLKQGRAAVCLASSPVGSDLEDLYLLPVLSEGH
jgi:hypothetical protein